MDWLDDINDWSDIEPLVEGCVFDAMVNGLIKKPRKRENLRDPVPLGETFCDLSESEITDSGWKGRDTKNKNDCLIHSLFSCLSPTFRQLDSDYDRNVIAAHFRRKVLVDWLQKRFINPRLITEAELEGNDLLEDSLGDELCRKFGVNVLWVQNAFGVKHATFKDNESEFTICIYGDGFHFQPVRLVIEDQEDYIIRNFDGATYISSCFPAETAGERICDFNNGDPVMYNGEIYIVDERVWGIEGQPCTHVRIIKNPENTKDFIKVPISEITKVSGGDKRRHRSRTKKHRKQHNRKTGKRRF